MQIYNGPIRATINENEEKEQVEKEISRIHQMNVETFLEYVYQLVKDNKSESASVDVIDYIDTLHSKGHFEACNQLITKVDLKRLPSHLRRSILMITYPAKDKLPQRSALYEDAIKLITEEQGPQKAQQILKNLI